ncbi:hypothetical protein [Actinocorallia sp. A-T 12471]|uniref:hypothetical protein n=1 Tax=Actinocorallia sp. A-T 12471 TaxID=3089813 RepID=UPI0029CE6A88|nr:hypothetical protein [Actinocorallia sp. A-T 12471]MDX6739539.1 hypothetical protein [Actinocorallia sp. A-T 12471]
MTATTGHLDHGKPAPPRTLPAHDAELCEAMRVIATADPADHRKPAPLRALPAHDAELCEAVRGCG